MGMGMAPTNRHDRYPPFEEEHMSTTLTGAQSTHGLSLEDVGQKIIALAQDLLMSACTSENELYHFFQAIAYHVEENGPDMSAPKLTAMLRSEIAILEARGIDEDAAGDDMNFGWSEPQPQSKYKTETPEENHVLKVLLRHRIMLSGVDSMDHADHYDPKACEPKAEKILGLLDTSFGDNAKAAEQLDMLHKYVPQFHELAELYESVALKHGINVARSEQDWLADKNVEELFDIKDTPVDLSAALERYSMNYKIEKLVWEAQTSGSSELGARLRAFLNAVPEIYFLEARETFAELESLAGELPVFEDWLLESAVRGIFRTDVMVEIERLWSGREIAKRAGRMTLERLEAEGRIARKKQHGKLSFTRAA